jgi:hypothetical protein
MITIRDVRPLGGNRGAWTVASDSSFNIRVSRSDRIGTRLPSK